MTSKNHIEICAGPIRGNDAFDFWCLRVCEELCDGGGGGAVLVNSDYLIAANIRPELSLRRCPRRVARIWLNMLMKVCSKPLLLDNQSLCLASNLTQKAVQSEQISQSGNSVAWMYC
jgi:hypothetical protein